MPVLASKKSRINNSHCCLYRQAASPEARLQEAMQAGLGQTAVVQMKQFARSLHSSQARNHQQIIPPDPLSSRQKNVAAFPWQNQQSAYWHVLFLLDSNAAELTNSIEIPPWDCELASKLSTYLLPTVQNSRQGIMHSWHVGCESCEAPAGHRRERRACAFHVCFCQSERGGRLQPEHHAELHAACQKRGMTCPMHAVMSTRQT